MKSKSLTISDINDGCAQWEPPSYAPCCSGGAQLRWYSLLYLLLCASKSIQEGLPQPGDFLHKPVVSVSSVLNVPVRAPSRRLQLPPHFAKYPPLSASGWHFFGNRIPSSHLCIASLLNFSVLNSWDTGDFCRYWILLLCFTNPHPSGHNSF